VVLIATSGSHAAETHVAVAANFSAAAKEIAERFKEKIGHTALLSFASTGQLYTQITQGAPFDVFLAADAERPEKAVAEGFAVPDSRFTYATGRLVLWSADPDRIRDSDILKSGTFSKIALANPKTAPYGAAALEVMRAMGIYEDLRPKIVEGENITQAHQFVATGNAELGFVALAQVTLNNKGSYWLVPADMHTPLHQQAVLLKEGTAHEAAKAFVDFLKGPDAKDIIYRYGYATE
jgi:molybdate transport system substrate-binding protein